MRKHPALGLRAVIGMATSLAVVLLVMAIGLVELASRPRVGATAATPTTTFQSAITSDYAVGYYTLHDIKAHSQVIVVATVLSQQDVTGIDPISDLASTLTVNAVLSGTIAVGSTLVVIQLGGAGATNETDPHLLPGERAILFLDDQTASNHYVIQMGGLGHFISVGGTVRPLLPLPTGFLASPASATTLANGTLSESNFLVDIASV